MISKESYTFAKNDNNATNIDQGHTKLRMTDKKIFIIGLPRTGTTSACVALLDLGYKVAHCAVTEGSLIAADVIGDTPAYCDYKILDERFPQSKFIYLERAAESWLPSIKSLLNNMITGINAAHGGFPPAVKRCYKEIFHPITTGSIISDTHLSSCYTRHKSDIHEYFKDRHESFLAIDICHADAYKKMISFLGVSSTMDSFQKLNSNGQIVSWRELQHKNKIRLNLLSANGKSEFL